MSTFDPKACVNCNRANIMSAIGTQMDPMNPGQCRVIVERRCDNCGLVLANNFLGKNAEDAVLRAIEKGWVATERKPQIEQAFDLRSIGGN